MGMGSSAGNYDVIVIGGGHAGCEGALAAARMGQRTLLVTLNLEAIALMPCNPAVGGPAKGHLVREVDALGGEMGRNIDATCLQVRMLNTAKGPAVHALRAQADKRRYEERMRRVLEETENLDLRQGMVEALLTEKGQISGVLLTTGTAYHAPAVVLTTGTYLRGKIILGEKHYDGAPGGQVAPRGLSQNLKELGLNLMRFKTGTPARVDGRTLDFQRMVEQPGDEEPQCFSFSSKPGKGFREQLSCWLTHTNPGTHRVIRENLHRSPLFTGQIEGTGPRYCPSIEDKVVRFADKPGHQVFLEPEGRHTLEYYVQGMSTSLPEDVQLAMLRTVEGMEKVRIIRPGYAIEYDCIEPTQLERTLEAKAIQGLFAAGQVNGTSGYEEAAAQGILAGINAAQKSAGQEMLVLERSQAYLGVLVDDLVTKGTPEPYRMLTSRAEYRLLLRQDNADLRLTPTGYRLGLVKEGRYRLFKEKKDKMEAEVERLKKAKLNPTREIQEVLSRLGTGELSGPVTLERLLKRPEIDYEKLKELPLEFPDLDREVEKQVEIQIKYAGYIEKQQAQVEKFLRMEKRLISQDVDYESVPGLRKEAREKLKKLKPRSLGQAGRISGVTPADLSLLLLYMEQVSRARKVENS